MAEKCLWRNEDEGMQQLATSENGAGMQITFLVLLPSLTAAACTILRELFSLLPLAIDVFYFSPASERSILGRKNKFAA